MPFVQVSHQQSASPPLLEDRACNCHRWKWARLMWLLKPASSGNLCFFPSMSVQTSKAFVSTISPTQKEMTSEAGWHWVMQWYMHVWYACCLDSVESVCPAICQDGVKGKSNAKEPTRKYCYDHWGQSVGAATIQHISCEQNRQKRYFRVVAVTEAKENRNVYPMFCHGKLQTFTTE